MSFAKATSLNRLMRQYKRGEVIILKTVRMYNTKCRRTVVYIAIQPEVNVVGLSLMLYGVLCE